jgi:manganese-dependent ADP-ribose/CDP-alcohol diphosphatase
MTSEYVTNLNESVKLPTNYKDIDFTDEEEKQDLTIRPATTFCVLTDIQYADINDGKNYDQTKTRYYRNSLVLAKEAVKYWRKYEQETQNKIKCLIQLGDLVDGKSSQINDSLPAMKKCLNELNALFEPDQILDENGLPRLIHIWGNHEFYNFKRKELVELSLNSARALRQNLETNANYYYYQVSDKLRLLCLDYYEFSAIGFDEDDPIYLEALEMLKKHNKNSDLNSVAGMRGHAMRFSKFNGSMSEKQMKWFEEQLKECNNKGINVIICGHVPLHAKASDIRCLAWNYKEMLDLIWNYEKNVIAYFCGHDHSGGYFRDKHNIHHITFPGIIETHPNTNSYATCKVFDDRVSLEGSGLVSNYEIHFKQ